MAQPDDPTDLPARSWKEIVKRTVKEFQADNLTDWGAALTYYGVMSLFPMLIVLVALLGIVGQESTITTVTDSLRTAGLQDVAHNVQGPLNEIVHEKGGAGALLGFGLRVSHFGSYGKTYGTLGSVITFLVWIWLSNLALLFGGELDSELERERELKLGLPAEKELRLRPRQAPGGG